jgi:hypothetical protein
MKNDCYRDRRVFPLCVLVYSVAEIEQIQASNRLSTLPLPLRPRPLVNDTLGGLALSVSGIIGCLRYLTVDSRPGSMSFYGKTGF